MLVVTSTERLSGDDCDVAVVMAVTTEWNVFKADAPFVINQL